jgi:hypothetical protein
VGGGRVGRCGRVVLHRQVQVFVQKQLY